MGIRKVLQRTFSGKQRSYKNPVVNPACEEFEVDNWQISTFVVDDLLPVVGTHPFPLNELMLMSAAVCRIQPTHIFEWGTNIGKSARVFFETCRAFSITTEIHSIDLPDDVEHEEHPGAGRGHLVRGLPGVYLHLGDGLSVALELCSTLPTDQPRPLFFLDGDHAYDSVKRELSGILEKHPKASILLHDTFDQSSRSGYNIGPYQAIQDVLATTPQQFKIIKQDQGLPGMTLLWHP